ncbi:protein translocase subunit SecF [Clostridium oryzae]|uniref:Protein-export membrane protein SecF n=1 Tax=Clostridium oryzae TaxID=1450648 RepID=A0A1V4IUL1_9CLOT|nr:protein translocase subunit SecF [Clostridium oryzae]OPJ63583.1 protein-export membrane protein SecF [Clostridium oryzae]
MLDIIGKTKVWFTISLILILIGTGFLFVRHLNFGIDFKGGSVITIEMGKSFDKEKVETIVKKYASDEVTNTVNRTQLEIKSNSLTEKNFTKMFAEMKKTYKLKDKALISQNQIGGTIGAEMTRKALWALVVANLLMLVYIGVRFKEFSFGFAAIIALIHDLLITISVYAVFHVTVNSPFIAAILTILGYSINDTIVIFDRIRENNKKLRGRTKEEIGNISVNETITRSINTVMTVLITITAVYFFVPSVRELAFPLIIGIVSGAYSSIFIATPVWVLIKDMQQKHKKKKLAAARA